VLKLVIGQRAGTAQRAMLERQRAMLVSVLVALPSRFRHRHRHRQM
jgi:hypothetical protein